MSTLLEQVVAGEAPELVPLTVEQYHQMLAAGILRSGDPVELIDGLLVWKDRRDSRRPEMIQGPEHVLAMNRLFHAIYGRVLGRGCYAQCQVPLMILPNNAPEPDVSVIVGQPQDYRDRLPSPNDTIAVMEIADSSLRFDRTTKQRLYADAGIPVYWLVNLSTREIEVYTSPLISAGRYENRDCRSMDQSVTLALRDGGEIEVPVAEILL